MGYFCQWLSTENRSRPACCRGAPGCKLSLLFRKQACGRISLSLNKAAQKGSDFNEPIRPVRVNLVNHLQGWGQGGTQIRQRGAGKGKEQDNVF